MALITCPECHKEISNTVSQCIHCGAAITLCPECGKALTKKDTFCPNCGYQVTETVLVSETKKEVEESSALDYADDKNVLHNVIAAYKKESKAYKVLDIVITIINIPFLIIAVCLFSLTLISTMYDIFSDDLLGSTLYVLGGLLEIFMGVFVFFGGLLVFSLVFIQNIIMKVSIKKQGFDFKKTVEYILQLEQSRQNRKNIDTKELSRINSILNPMKSTLGFIYYAGCDILQFIFGIIGLGIACIFILPSVSSILSLIPSSDTPLPFFIAWFALIIGCFIVGMIVFSPTIIRNNRINKLIKKWQANPPESIDKN